MEIFLFSRPEATHGEERLRELAAALDTHFPGKWRANAPFAVKLGRPEAAWDAIPASGERVVVSYGGDGTFLECVRMARGVGAPVLGINSGRLGFLANVPEREMGAAFDELAGAPLKIECRAALHVEGDFPSLPPHPFAFNEFSVQRGAAEMIAVEILVDGQMVATCRGDGVMISTPSGSTAYNLSVGGPVLAPGCECFVISPIAPHNLTMRPVVVPNHAEITFRVLPRGGKAYATLDNQTFHAACPARFSVRRAKDPVKLVRLSNTSFYDTLRGKMMWGVDSRDERRDETKA